MPRDTRPFITVHDGMPNHPKIEALSDPAFRLLVTTWCWCNQNRTDGRVREASWSKRGTRKARQELIEAGLAEPTDDGVQMHDYLEHQRSAAEIDELSAKRREAGSKGGKARATAVASAKANASANGKQTDSKSVAEEEREEELARHPSSKTRARRARLPEDWKPTPADVEWQRGEGISDLDARRQLPMFVDHWTGKGEARADWSATWRNWLRRSRQYGPPRPPARDDDDPLGWAR